MINLPDERVERVPIRIEGIGPGKWYIAWLPEYKMWLTWYYHDGVFSKNVYSDDVFTDENVWAEIQRMHLEIWQETAASGRKSND